jgi:hypothetical protein
MEEEGGLVAVAAEGKWRELNDLGGRGGAGGTWTCSEEAMGLRFPEWTSSRLKDEGFHFVLRRCGGGRLGPEMFSSDQRRPERRPSRDHLCNVKAALVYAHFDGRERFASLSIGALMVATVSIAADSSSKETSSSLHPFARATQ